MAVRPFVVAEDKDQGMRHGLELGVPAEKELVRARTSSTLEVPVVHNKDQILVGAERFEQRQEPCLLFVGIGDIAEQRKVKRRRAFPFLGDSRRRKTTPQRQRDEYAQEMFQRRPHRSRRQQVCENKPVARDDFSCPDRHRVAEHRAGVGEGVELTALAAGVC